MSKLDKESLCIDEVWTNRLTLSNEEVNVIGIEWSGNIGFGRYELIIRPDGSIIGNSECLDSNEDKSFLRALLDKLVDKVSIDD